MQLPLQVSFRHMEPSAALEELVRAKASRLDTYADQIMSCRVMIEPAGRHHRHGNQYSVRLDITVPGGEIAVTRGPGEHSEYRSIIVALRDAFDAARRQLEDHVRHRRGFVKAHETAPHGHVSQLFPEKGYGFLTTPEGREIYFHRNSVLDNKFDDLEIGTLVAFVEVEGQKGPQASTVRLVGRRHHP